MSTPRAPLTFEEVHRACLQRSLRWHPGGLEEWSVSDWAVATAGEGGEATEAVLSLALLTLATNGRLGQMCNTIKKYNRVRDQIANENDPGRRIETVEAAMAAIGEEAADTVIYLFSLAARCGFDLGAEIVRKFNLVSERYGFPERL